MRTYTLHLDRDALAGEAQGLERAHLVADGFSWTAFAFGPLWFLYHRLWLGTLGAVALLAATAYAGRLVALNPVAGFAVTALVLLLIGLEASSVRRWTYARRGRPVRDAVLAGSLEEAEMKAAARWFEGAAPARPALTPYGNAPARPSETAIGMFPMSEGRR